jgi:nitrite reductase/ring-hydroxylating ferredoxin subunit
MATVSTLVLPPGPFRDVAGRDRIGQVRGVKTTIVSVAVRVTFIRGYSRAPLRGARRSACAAEDDPGRTLTAVPRGADRTRMLVVDVGGTKVSLASVGGHVFAFDDVCTHQECSLGEGELDGTTVTCPCHGSQFEVTSGAVLRGPALRPVRSRAIQIQGEDVLVEAQLNRGLERSLFPSEDKIATMT